MTSTDAATDKAKGTVKEGAGKLTGDHKTEAEGKVDKVMGDVKDKLSDAKDKVSDAVKKVTD